MQSPVSPSPCWLCPHAEDAPLGTDLGSRSVGGWCPVPSGCRRSPAPLRPRTSSARSCRGTAGAGTGPARRTGARGRRPRVKAPVAPPAGTSARVRRASAAGWTLPAANAPTPGSGGATQLPWSHLAPGFGPASPQCSSSPWFGEGQGCPTPAPSTPHRCPLHKLTQEVAQWPQPL